jgi:hypothetical protein
VYRKVMGDAPMAYVETEGGRRVAEDDVVVKGKNDVSRPRSKTVSCIIVLTCRTDPKF